jgi:hypothetical protein
MGNVAQLPGAANGGSTILPGLIDRARAQRALPRKCWRPGRPPRQCWNMPG